MLIWRTRPPCTHNRYHRTLSSRNFTVQDLQQLWSDEGVGVNELGLKSSLWVPVSLDLDFLMNSVPWLGNCGALEWHAGSAVENCMPRLRVNIWVTWNRIGLRSKVISKRRYPALVQILLKCSRMYKMHVCLSDTAWKASDKSYMSDTLSRFTSYKANNGIQINI